MSLTSTSGLGVSGLASGLDTTGIITKLMSIEAQPQTQLKTQLSTATTFRTALQNLNSSIASIATAAQTSAASGALTAFTATSSITGITAVADKTAAAGSISFAVTQLAKPQVSVTDAMSTRPDTSTAKPSITIALGSGPSATTKTVTAASNSIDDIVAAINGGGAGVTATKVAAGTDANGVQQYRLQLRSNATGAAAAFTAYPGADASGAPLATTTVSTAQDASLTLWPGSTVAQTVTSASNTFSDLLTGVDVTVSAVTTDPATLTVAPDASKATSAAASLAAGLGALFANINTQSAVSTTSSSTGSTTGTTAGVFAGDLAVRQIKSDLLAAATGAVNGVSPSTIGFTLTKDGTVTFDQAAFSAAMAKDPAGTTAMFQTIAGRVQTSADAISNQYTGTLTSRITSAKSQESQLNDQISDWDTRLAAIKANYQTQYNALETALSNLSSQASYLTSQLAGLTTKYTD
jgi:flagellar hook-associated protein 2